MLGRVQFSSPYVQQKNVSFAGIKEAVKRTFTRVLEEGGINNPGFREMVRKFDPETPHLVQVTDESGRVLHVSTDEKGGMASCSGRGSTIDGAYEDLFAYKKGLKVAGTGITLPHELDIEA